MPVTAVTKFGEMPSCVAVLPAPVSLSTHCARSGLAPFAVLMLPLATSGSTRFCPETDVYVALPRHCHTGLVVKAEALGTESNVAAVAVASATRSLRVIRVLPRCDHCRTSPSASASPVEASVACPGVAPRRVNVRPSDRCPGPIFAQNPLTGFARHSNIPAWR